MAKEYSLLQIDLTDDELAAARADAAAASLPLDGVILTPIVAEGIETGQLADQVLMSAQQHLVAMADKIERHGIDDDDVFDVVAKLRILSQYATTRIVPVDPY